jgi:hypothetical protein
VVRHIFQACPVWIYIQSNITSKTHTVMTYLKLSILRIHVIFNLLPRIEESV